MKNSFLGTSDSTRGTPGNAVNIVRKDVLFKQGIDRLDDDAIETLWRLFAASRTG